MKYSRIYIALMVMLLPIDTHAGANSFTGFWKGDCTDAFGAQIKPYNNQLNSICVCGQGGYSEPEERKPNAIIVNDPDYRIIEKNVIQVRVGNRWDRYQKWTNDTNPVLDYPPMKKKELTSKLIFFEPYKGLPDYEKTPPFKNTDTSVHQELKKSILSASPGPIECDSGSVPVPGLFSFALKTNVCKTSDFSRIKENLVKLAPSLKQENLTFWLTNYDEDEESEVIVGYVDISKDEHFKYPYLSLWLLDFKKNKYQSVYAGPFLAGVLHCIKPFGPFEGKKMVFVKHQSCIECEPWVYLTVIDFSNSPSGAAFQFTYSPDHTGFGYTIEYDLPGMGHSVDADVESRIPCVFNKSGPHLIQNFNLKRGGKEWWIFTCRGYKCDYEMHMDHLPQKYITLWKSADKL